MDNELIQLRLIYLYIYLLDIIHFKIEALQLILLKIRKFQLFYI